MIIHFNPNCFSFSEYAYVFFFPKCTTSKAQSFILTLEPHIYEVCKYNPIKHTQMNFKGRKQLTIYK